MGILHFTGYGANIAGTLGSGSLIQDMPSAMQLNGTDAYANGSTNMSTVTGTTATVSMWVYYTGSQTNQGEKVLFSDSSSETRKILMQTRNYGSHGTSFRYGYVDSDGGGVAAKDTGGSSGLLTSGTWQHFAIVADGRSVSLHVDGEQYSDATYNAAGTNSYAITTPHLGRAAFSAGRYFPGYIRNVQVYNVSSSDAQVVELMNDEFPHGTPIHWWTCNDGATNDDGSGTDSDLTLNNTVEDKSFYNLNQIGVGSVSGSVTVSGGTLNLRDETTYLDFNGSASYVDLGASVTTFDGATEGSVSAWIKLDTLGSERVIIARYDSTDSNRQFNFEIDGSNKVKFIVQNNKSSYDGDHDVVGSTAIEAGVWNHVVGTFSTTNGQKVYLNGVYDGIASKDIEDALDTVSQNTYIGKLEQGGSSTAYFDGIIKDVAMYETELTSAQISLLFKSQWLGRPAHLWKLNEGTGNGTDSGQGSTTAQTQSTTWVKPDFTGDGPQLKAGTTMSAPEGNYILKYFAASSPERDWNQSATSTFIHNNGTVKFSSGDTGIYNSTTAGPFYNILNDESNTFNMRPSSKTIVENSFFYTAGYWVMSNGASLEMGTTSSAGTISGNNVSRYAYSIGGGNTTFSISGASKVYPSIWKGTIPTDTYWRGYAANSAGTATYEFKNLDIQGTVTLGSGTSTGGHNRATNFTLEGDTEFDAVTVGGGCQFDLNGQRVKFSDDFTVDSGGHNNGAGLIFAEGDFTDGNGTGNSYTTKTLVMDGGYCNPAQTTWQQMFLRNGTHTIGGNRDWGGTPIIMGGTSNFTSNNTWGNITIPTGGTLDGNAAVVTAEGDFNMAGGLIGKSALLCSGAHWASGASVLNYSSTDVTAISIGAWVKNIDIANGDGNQMILRQNDNFVAVQSDGSLYVGVEVSQANGTSWDYPGLVTDNGTISDDNKWHHISMTWASGSTLKAYLDGKLVGEKTDIGAEYVKLRPRAAAQPVGVGAYQGNSEYEGTIAQACRWHTELSESDIRTHMFQDFSSLASTTNLIYWYQFDSANGTAILDSSTNDCDLTSVTVASNAAEAAWVGPGTYTYDTSTLKFDKAGTCNFTGHQDATATNMYSVHITSGTTVEANCRDNDLIMNSGSLMTNSGTLNSNRNWQYKSRNMPIVGPNSDLKVSTNIWYYMSDGSGLPASGAGTNYYQLRPATNVYMQGDFDCQNGLLQSGGDLHLNGYACSTSKIWNYGGGNLHADPGSSIVFDNADGFNVSYGATPTDMFFVASGEAAYQATTDAAGNNTEGVYTNTLPFGSGTSQMSVSYWIQIPASSSFFDASLLRCVWGFGSIFTGTPTVASHPGMWGHTIQSSWIKNDFYSYDNPADADSDFSRIHENFTKPINWTGTGPYGWHHICTTVGAGTGADTLKTYVDGVEVDSRQKPKEFLNVGNGNPGLSVHGAHLNDNLSSYGTQMSLSDFRVYSGTTLTSGNAVTLASENPATSVSGAYADPDNALGATLWWKLNATPLGTLDTTDSAGTNNGTGYGGAKSGFVTISGSVTPYNPVNNLYPAGVTLKNVYMSGSKDIVAGQRKENSAGFMAASSQTVITQGTVVMD